MANQTIDFSTQPAVNDSPIRRVVLREVQRIRAEWIYPLLMIILPVIGFGLIIVIFWDRTPSDLPVAVFDGDNTPLARQIVRYVDATRTMHVREMLQSESETEPWLREGHGYAVIVIPRGVQEGVLRGEQRPIIAYVNGQWLLPASLISRDLLQTTLTVSKGIDVKARVARGMSVGTAMARVNPIRVDAAGLFNPQLDYVTYLVLALLPTLLQIFLVVVTVHAIGIELKRGTAGDWLETAGGNVFDALIGKLVPYWISGAIIVGIAWLLLSGLLDIAIHGSTILVVIAFVLLVLACQSVGIALVAITANLRFATSIASLLTGPAFAFTGVTFPAMGMPLVAKLWGMLLPLTHVLAILTEQVLVGAPARVSLPRVGILLLFLLLPLLTLGRLNKVLRDPVYWRRI